MVLPRPGLNIYFMSLSRSLVKFTPRNASNVLTWNSLVLSRQILLLLKKKLPQYVLCIPKNVFNLWKIYFFLWKSGRFLFCWNLHFFMTSFAWRFILYICIDFCWSLCWEQISSVLEQILIFFLILCLLFTPYIPVGDLLPGFCI